MTQSLLTIVLFIGLMAAMPFAIRRLQQKRALPMGPSGPACKLISALAVGPQQRILTVEVGPEGARSWLVVGVSAQGITPLHTVAAPEPFHVAQ